MLTCILGLTIISTGSDFRHADVVTVSRKPMLRIEGRANTYTFSSQNHASLDVLQDGRFAIAWESRKQRNGLSGAYFRTFDPIGTPSTPEAATTSDKEFPQLSPSVALGIDGSAQVAYASRFRDGRDTPAYLGDVRLESGKGLQYDPLVARGPDGKYVAVWIGEVAHLQTRVFMQTFDSAHKPLQPATLVSSIDQIESVPSLAADNGKFAIVWQRYGLNKKPAGLQARIFDWNAAAISSVCQVGSPNALEPSFDVRANGFVLGWTEPNEKQKFVAAAQRLDRNLKPESKAIHFQSQSGDQNAVAVAGRSDGKFVVGWNHRANEDTDLYTQFFDAKGKAEGKAFRPTRKTEGFQGMAEVSGTKRLAYSDRGLLIAWSGNSGNGDEMGANFTILLSNADENLISQINANAARTEPPSKGGVPTMRFDSMATRVAEPHEPPISNFKKVVNPWDVQIPMANGGFNAYSQTSFTPPDCDLAVGPTHLIVTVNDGIAFYTRDGGLTYMNNMRQTNGFWGQLAASDNFIFDPEVLYDSLTGRFFVMACQGGGGTAESNSLVAVSDDSNPNGTWFLYKFNTTNLAGNLFDSQNIGVDANVVYVTGDGFGISANYPVYCIQKAPLLLGQQPGIIRSTAMPTSTQSAGIPPVQDSGNRFYMVEHKEAANNTAIDIIALADPLGAPNFTRFTLPVPSYAAPGDPPQSGTSSRVNTFDQRFWSVKYKNGYLWATHHINSRTVARWYQIDPRGWPTSGQNPVLVQSGNIDLGATVYTFFSAIAADDGNNVGMAYGRGSTAEFYSANHSSRRFTDAAGTMSGHTIDMAATGPYTAGRWGDYHGCDVDPEYPGLMWGFAEWAEGGSWRAWVQPFYVTNELWANKITMILGSIASGNYKDLIYDDGASMRFQNATSQTVERTRITYELKTRTRKLSQNATTLQFAYKAGIGDLRLRTQLFDNVLGQFVDVDNRLASTSPELVNVQLTNPTRFVRPSDGAVICRQSLMINGPIAAAFVDFDLNRWAWIEN